MERANTERVRFRTAAATGTDDSRAQGFADLLAAELARSYRLAAVILGSAVEAEDAVHDAAEAAWRRWSELRAVASAPVWFRRILINRCRDRLRRRARLRTFEVLRAPLSREHPTSGDSSEAASARDELARAFEQLAPDERVVLVLRYEQDLTVPSIAELLDVPVGTVKSRLHNALGKLRTELGGPPR